MTRPIVLTEEQKRGILAEVLASLNANKNMFDGKVSFSKTYKWTSDEEDISTINFTPLAFAKMHKLIMDYSTEVAWHGVIKRDQNDDSVFWVEDILVYPQVVTGATVNTDQEKYTNWINELTDDQFNNLKFQGHSHVNMGVSPSTTDTSHQKDIIEQLRGEMFYVFMIWNKRFEFNAWVYDMKRNTVYDGNDVKVNICDRDGVDIGNFVAEAKKLASPSTSYGTASYTSFGSGKATTSQVTKIETNEAKPTSYEVIPDKSATAHANKSDKPTGKKRERAKPKIGAGWAGKTVIDPEEYWEDYERLLRQ